MPGLNDIVAQMRTALALTDPDLDTSVGTTTRKIIDVTAEGIAEAYLDQHMTTYQYDIDSKAGADLEDFCALFGISRYAAHRASGTVIFYRGAGDAVQQAVIPVGTQVGSDSTPTITVVTITPAFLDVGVQSISVPVQALDGGEQGNIGAGLLTRLLTPIGNITSVTNINPLEGGTPYETDTALRDRWKKTALRSLAGTEQMYLGIAGDDVDVFAAAVIGGTRRYREQVQIVDQVATSGLVGAKYIYPASAVMGPNIDAGEVLLRDHDYEFNTSTNPPSVEVIGDTYLVGFEDDGTPITADYGDNPVFDLTYTYVPTISRNDPSHGINNRVDVYVAGTRAVDATQSVVFSARKRFSGSDSDYYRISRFLRDDQTNPQVNNVFIPLAFGPIVTLPPELNVGGDTYLLGTDYWTVHDVTPEGWTATSLFGIEWNASNLPADGAVFPVENGYTYNGVISNVQANIEAARLIGTDVQVHQATMILLRFNLAVIYLAGYSQDSVNTQIQQAISSLCNQQGFGRILQTSDVLQYVHNVPGVDAVRFVTSTDNPDHFAIERMLSDGTVIGQYEDGGRAIDIGFADNETPVFHSIAGGRTANTPMIKAQNSFGTG